MGDRGIGRLAESAIRRIMVVLLLVLLVVPVPDANAAPQASGPPMQLASAPLASSRFLPSGRTTCILLSSLSLPHLGGISQL